MEINKTMNEKKREARAKFIEQNESGTYGGHNEDNEEVMVVLEQGKSMVIKTRRAEDMGNWEIAKYDKDGYVKGEVTYEPYN
jgi:hypothetical protein